MILLIFSPAVMAAFLATHDLRVITCNGGEAVPYYHRMMDVAALTVGKGSLTSVIET